MSEAGLASNGGFAIAVAAATYAISSIGREGEKEGALSKKKPVDELQGTSTKTKSKEESTTAKPTGSTTVLRWLSGKEEKEDKGSAGKFPSLGDPDGTEVGLQASLTKTKSKKEDSNGKGTDANGISRWFSRREEKEDKEPAGISTTTEKTRSEDLAVDEKKPIKEISMVPSIRKTPTFMDKHQNDMGSNMFAREKEKATGQNASAAVKTKTSFTDDHKSNLSTSKKAIVWEKAELAKIQRRYDKQYAKILEWEDEKKKIAKSRSERIEGKLELRRAIASQELRNEIAKIDKIVARARAAADEKRKTKERKTMEKANEIRETGKIPHECFCI
ncbi:hypothetical protein Taro_019953 [Colocasia esculenta]|uniref:Remorin C-terminal domain-containing protein n=1 Tax=Colocasia esculenta TaxID=4460 RepID=A0A843UMC3_COLES|nr:hypothetical protein [Colocasia esculenta]